jgi:hypothetical protein
MEVGHACFAAFRPWSAIAVEAEVPSPQREPATMSPQRAGERMVIEIKGIDYAFRWCPSGKFLMGSLGQILVSP